MADNSFYKGTSYRETLINLILKLRTFELEGYIILHMIHVSGKWMIDSRVNTLSREDTTLSITRGNSLLSYFSFHLGAHQRSAELIPWINSWWKGKEPLVHLSPDGWFDNIFTEGNYLWTPPPA